MDIKQHFLTLFDMPSISADTILSRFVEEDLKKGTCFVDTGQHCDRLSFIATGLFRVYVETADREVTQWIGGAGYFVTDLSSFLFGDAVRWRIQALTDAKIYSLYKSDYLEFERLIPDWNLLEKRFIAKCFMQLEQRVFDFIALSAEERYVKLFEQNKMLFNQVPLQYLASMLGMSPETLSRIRTKLSS